ncbi:MAG TPA: hypothetical protein VFW48_00635, partial [Solirubrobacterales bacterium]|nr:hypothetical protein [Solirubrobacterales bacterium]
QATGLVKLSSECNDPQAITVLSARTRQPDRVVSHYLEIEDQHTQIAHVTALIDAGKPSVCLIDSYSSVGLVPWVLPAAQAFEAGELPKKPSSPPELTRATVAIEHTFFGEWGSSQVGAAAGDPALMGRLVQFGRANGSARERPLEFARFFHRADGAQLAFELG